MENKGLDEPANPALMPDDQARLLGRLKDATCIKQLYLTVQYRIRLGGSLQTAKPLLMVGLSSLLKEGEEKPAYVSASFYGHVEIQIVCDRLAMVASLAEKVVLIMSSDPGDAVMKTVISCLGNVKTLKIELSGGTSAASHRSAPLEEFIAQSTSLQEMELMYKQLDSFGFAGRCLRDHPNICGMRFVVKLPPSVVRAASRLTPSFESIHLDVLALSTMKNLTDVEINFNIPGLVTNPDLVSSVISVIANNAHLQSVKLPCRLELAPRECQQLAEALQSSRNLRKLEFGGHWLDPDVPGRLLHHPAMVHLSTPGIVFDAMTLANTITELFLHSSSLLRGGGQQQGVGEVSARDAALVFRYFSTSSSTLRKLTVRGACRPISVFTILLGLAHNTSLETLVFKSCCSRHSLETGFWDDNTNSDHSTASSFANFWTELRDRCGITAVDPPPSLLSLILDLVAANPNLRHLSVDGCSSGSSVAADRRLWNLLSGGGTSLSSMERLEWFSLHQENDCSDRDEYAELLRGWASVLRSNWRLQRVWFRSYEPPEEPNPEAFNEESDDEENENRYREAFEEYVGEEEESKRFIEDTVEPYEAEFDGWVKLNTACGQQRARFLENPYEANRQGVLDLLCVVSDFPSCTFSLLQSAPAVFFNCGDTPHHVRPTKKPRISV